MTYKQKTVIEQIERGSLCRLNEYINTGQHHYEGDVLKPVGILVTNGHWEVLFEYEAPSGYENDQVNLSTWLDTATPIS